MAVCVPSTTYPTHLRPKTIILCLGQWSLKPKVGSAFFLRIETSIIKTPTKTKHGIFVKKSLGSAGSDR